MTRSQIVEAIIRGAWSDADLVAAVARVLGRPKSEVRALEEEGQASIRADIAHRTVGFKTIVSVYIAPEAELPAVDPAQFGRALSHDLNDDVVVDPGDAGRAPSDWLLLRPDGSQSLVKERTFDDETRFELEEPVERGPLHGAPAAAAPRFHGLRYEAGSENDPDGMGGFTLLVEGAGRLHLTHRALGRVCDWHGHVNKPALEKLSHLFLSLDARDVPQWAPPPAGETVRRLVGEGPSPKRIDAPWREALAADGYRDLFALLDQVVAQLSGGAIRFVRPGTERVVSRG